MLVIKVTGKKPMKVPDDVVVIYDWNTKMFTKASYGKLANIVDQKEDDAILAELDK